MVRGWAGGAGRQCGGIDAKGAYRGIPEHGGSGEDLRSSEGCGECGESGVGERMVVKWEGIVEGSRATGEGDWRGWTGEEVDVVGMQGGQGGLHCAECAEGGGS